MSDMLNKARMAFKVVCSLVFSVGMLAGLPGTASAQPATGTADFCDAATYDNANPQTAGSDCSPTFAVEGESTWTLPIAC